MPSVLRPTLLTALVAALLVPGATTAASATTATVTGTEVPPISSTLGTFTGVAGAPLRAVFRVQIAHEPLATGPSVAITGGSYSLVTLSRHRIGGHVTGGSVTVTDRGSHCTDQTYAVTVELSRGEFDGTLTHRRRSILHRCVLYAATIRGQLTLSS